MMSKENVHHSFHKNALTTPVGLIKKSPVKRTIEFKRIQVFHFDIISLALKLS